MYELRDYQADAVDIIYNFLNSCDKKAKIYLSHGLGTNLVIASCVKLMIQNNNVSVLILFDRRVLCNQFESIIDSVFSDNEPSMNSGEFKNKKIFVTTYQDIIKTKFDLDSVDIVICNGISFLKKEYIISLLEESRAKVLGVLQNKVSYEGVFEDANCLFSYTTSDALRDGYMYDLSKTVFIKEFLTLLLEKYGYNEISQKNNTEDINHSADIVAKKDLGKVAIDVKIYRNVYVSQTIISNALEQILKLKELYQNQDQDNWKFILILLCKVDDKLQEQYFKDEEIMIWDINNLLYMCEGDKELSDLLVKCMPYSLTDLELQKPVLFNDIKKKEFDKSHSEATFYIEKLKNCKLGKNDKEDNLDKEYEKICTDIIMYLFKTEFYKISEQHNTEDKMFRMDLLCSLKGTTEFWRFLINFYHTKFVVFEYKNYKEKISQNLIYITEKYLFPVALRNVAFIISRKGFDTNAEKAALGYLRENGKLFISIDDEDMIKMIHLKEKGEEPSDYLLDKLENWLMLVSK